MAGVESQTVVLLGITILIGVSLALLAVGLLSSVGGYYARERLRKYADPTQEVAGIAVEQSEVLRERRFSSIGRLDVVLRNNPLAVSAAQELTAARIPLRVGEYFALILFCAVMAASLVWMYSDSPLAAIGAGLLGGAAPKLYVSRRRSGRIRACEDQLVDLLSLSSNSLRSGWSFLQALEHVSTELPAPISEEVRQLLEEVSLGASPEEALVALQERIPSYDLELIITAVLIQRRAGGNLAEMMDTIAHTIRERIKLLGEIRVITAEARLSMWLLSLLPVGLLVILSAMNPGYVAPMFEDPRGRLLLLMAVALEVTGVFVLRRLAVVKV